MHNNVTGVIFILVTGLHITALAVVEICSIYFGFVIFRKKLRNMPSDIISVVEAMFTLNTTDLSTVHLTFPP